MPEIIETKAQIQNKLDEYKETFRIKGRLDDDEYYWLNFCRWLLNEKLNSKDYKGE